MLVHLPIGILLLAVLMEWLARREKFRLIQPAVRIALLSGSVVALLSCITGYLLSLQSAYQDDILSWHLAMGISTAALSTALFFLHRSPARWAARAYGAGCFALVGIIFVTGHLGGSLTHGSTYLTDVLPAPLRGWFSANQSEEKVIINVQDAQVYGDIIQPILADKCYNCHGASKQRGGLRLDKPDAIVKGGKNGKVIVAGKPFESEIIKRIYLPMNHDDHMPPRGKNQITASEIQLLQWWIAEEARFDRKVGDLPQPETIRPILNNLQTSDPEKTIFANTGLPEGPVSKAPDSLLVSLRNKNITVVPATRRSNYLSVSFLAVPQAGDEMIAILQPISDNVIELKLANTKITDKGLEAVGKMKNLVRLNLENTAVTDEGLKHFKGLGILQVLNLVGTKVTAKGLAELQTLKKLKKLYLYKTGVQDADRDMLKGRLPGVTLDRGGYQVPTLVDDTTLVKDKK